VQGVFDLLEHGGAKILPVIPQLILPIKGALPPLHPFRNAPGLASAVCWLTRAGALHDCSCAQHA
jgi:hypothetical protein